MNLSWSNRVIKYVLFVFNLLFVISGIVMIAVGVSVKSYFTDYDVLLNNSYFSLPNLLIATGSLIFFISFFGCCGAIKESWFMIFIFSVLLSLIFILEFSAGVAGYALRDQTTSYLEDKLKASMNDYQINAAKPNPTTYIWDAMQDKFQCCGASGPTDWAAMINPARVERQVGSKQVDDGSAPSSSSSTTSSSSSEESPTTPTTVVTTTTTEKTTESKSTTVSTSSTTPGPVDKNSLPGSCCKINSGATGIIVCSMTDNSTATYYTEGCVEAFGDFLKDHAVTLGGVGLAIAFIQLFGVIFACHLTKQLKHGFYST